MNRPPVSRGAPESQRNQTPAKPRLATSSSSKSGAICMKLGQPEGSRFWHNAYTLWHHWQQDACMGLTGKKTVRGAKPMEPAPALPALSLILAANTNPGSIFLQHILSAACTDSMQLSKTLQGALLHLHLDEDLHTPIRAMMSLKQFPSSSAKICTAGQRPSFHIQRCNRNTRAARYLVS